MYSHVTFIQSSIIRLIHNPYILFENHRFGSSFIQNIEYIIIQNTYVYMCIHNV